MEPKEIVSIWDLHFKINFDDIKQIFEGEKYSVVQEKIENLRKSSDSLASSSSTVELNESSQFIQNNTNDEEDGELTASTAPGIVFASHEERLQHFRSDYHRWNLKLRFMEMPLMSKEVCVTTYVFVFFFFLKFFLISLFVFC